VTEIINNYSNEKLIHKKSSMVDENGKKIRNNRNLDGSKKKFIR
jgi:hypothetical protein